MKIIFSPSKEMSFQSPYKEATTYSDKTNQIMDVLQILNKNEIKKIYKISDKVADEVANYINNFDSEESYRAIEMYTGLAFRKFDIDSLNKDERAYLDDHLLILSAFYGPINPEKLVRPYRLDMNTGIKINSVSLKNFWKDEFNEAFYEGETILNLASDEFSSLIDRKNFKIYDFDFFEKKDGKLKSHSTISKKSRGLMLNYICKNKIENLEDLKNFNLEGFRFDEGLSTESKFTFIKTI
ncbi:peroxide stress protein YaaA [Peptoniphilus sp.]|uniref:peroxide stress protein YaaA n=1 Tax=Peptoniphilus sp. TaxID=1971214 RepID=UPI003993B67A